MLTTILIKTLIPCAVCAGGALSPVDRDRPLVLPAPADGDVLFTVWGTEPGAPAIPYAVHISLKGGRAVGANIPAVDWDGLIEIAVTPLIEKRFVPQKPKLIDSAEFTYASKPARAELYCGNGLSLMLAPRGGNAVYFDLGEGENGRLRVLDMGSARVLTVTAETERGGRIAVLGRDAEILLDEEGSAGAGIADGLPSVTDALRSVRGLERRTRFELKNGVFVSLERELGFFTHDEHIPGSEAERALAAAEDALIGTGTETEFMSEELKAGLGGAALKAFFGDYSKAFLYPVEEREGRVTVGLASEDGLVARPRRFVFAFEGGLISDIEEM